MGKKEITKISLVTQRLPVASEIVIFLLGCYHCLHRCVKNISYRKYSEAPISSSIFPHKKKKSTKRPTPTKNHPAQRVQQGNEVPQGRGGTSTPRVSL